VKERRVSRRGGEREPSRVINRREGVWVRGKRGLNDEEAEEGAVE